jgi:hypothetical protein
VGLRWRRLWRCLRGRPPVLRYADFKGNEHEIEADVAVETERTRSSINSKLEWEETSIFVRVDGKIVGRKSLAYREYWEGKLRA